MSSDKTVTLTLVSLLTKRWLQIMMTAQNLKSTLLVLQEVNKKLRVTTFEYSIHMKSQQQ